MTSPPTTTKPPPTHGSASSSSSTSSAGAAFQACAVCKYQRRRCTPDCKLAPYFPAYKQKEFLNAHKKFGVHNIVQILNKVPENQREPAAESIIFEADARARHPVWGCVGVIRELEGRLEIATAELQTTLGLLDHYRRRRSFPVNSGAYDGISVNHVANQDKKPVIGGVENVLLRDGSGGQVMNNGVEAMEQFLNVSSGNEVQIKADDDQRMQHLPHLFLKN